MSGNSALRPHEHGSRKESRSIKATTFFLGILVCFFLLHLNFNYLFEPAKTDCGNFMGKSNVDGAYFVWYFMDGAGMKYDYKPAVEIPESPAFVEVHAPLPGDVVLIGSFLALYNGVVDGEQVVLTVIGQRTLRSLAEHYILGEVWTQRPIRWFRYKKEWKGENSKNGRLAEKPVRWFRYKKEWNQDVMAKGIKTKWLT